MTKRILALGLILMMVASMAGCGGGTTATQAPAPAATPTAAPAATQAPAPDPTEEPLDWPNGPITLILPTAAGGGVDTSGRIVAEFLSQELGVAIIPENHPGASGIPGHNAVLQRPDDGYTIGLCSIAYSPWVAKVTSADAIPWDPDESFRVLACYNEAPAMTGFFCHADKPWQTFDEMVKAIQAAPPKSINCGISGPGTPSDPSMMQFQELFGVELNIIYYPGSADQQSAILTGDIDFALAGVNNPAVLENPNYRVLCFLTTKDSIPSDYEVKAPLLDEFQDELGFDVKDADLLMLPVAGTWLMVKKGVDDRICDRLVEAMQKIVETPEFREKIFSIGSYPKFMDPEESLNRHHNAAAAMQAWLDTQ